MDPMVILLVEDDLGVQSFIWRLLKADGFRVLTAGDGEAALDVSRNCPGSIHLMLSDVEMPRMGGLELCKRITAERPGIKVLMMSGEPSCKEHVHISGLPFLQKPFTSTALRDSIEALLGPIPPLR
jgi:DNA-binding response OmpR family regulator